jgi:hypothetical protein
MAARTMTPEARAAKNARDRERRAQQRAGAVVPAKSERKPVGGGRRKPTQAELKRNAAAVLTMANMTLAGILPPAAMYDLLQPEEIEVLAAGLAAELQANPKILAYFHKMAQASGPHMVMLAACAVVAAPRLARRGMLPAPAAMAVQMAGTALVSGHGNTADFQSGSAHERGGGHGLGEVYPDGMVGESAPVRVDSEDEA